MPFDLAGPARQLQWGHRVQISRGDSKKSKCHFIVATGDSTHRIRAEALSKYHDIIFSSGLINVLHPRGSNEVMNW